MAVSLLTICMSFQRGLLPPLPCAQDGNDTVTVKMDTSFVVETGDSNNLVIVPANGLLCSDHTSSPSDPDCQHDPKSTLGAEISGIRDFTTLTDTQIRVIRNALNKHKVVYFKGAAPLLTPMVQLSFAERFGDVLPDVSNVPKYVEKGVHQSAHSAQDWAKIKAVTTGTDSDRNASTSIKSTLQRPDQDRSAVASMVDANKAGSKKWRGISMPERVTRLVREPGDPFAFGEGLHADVTFFPKPPVYTFLVGRELPGGQDDTHFVDVGRAWRELPSHIREQTAGLSAVHNDSAGMHTVHPAVRTHPETGENAVYVNSHFTHPGAIVGYSEPEGGALLADIFAHVEAQPRFKFKWRCGHADSGSDSGSISPAGHCGAHPGPFTSSECSECLHVLMWDNRALQHSSTTHWAADEKLNKRRRELHRITISDSAGERPFYRP